MIFFIGTPASGSLSPDLTANLPLSLKAPYHVRTTAPSLLQSN